MYPNLRPEIARVAEQTVVNLKELEGRIEVLKNDLAALCTAVGHPEAARLAVTPAAWLNLPPNVPQGSFGSIGGQGSLGTPYATQGFGQPGLGSQFGQPGIGPQFGQPLGVPFATPYGVGPLGSPWSQGISPWMGSPSPWAPSLNPYLGFTPYGQPPGAPGFR